MATTQNSSSGAPLHAAQDSSVAGGQGAHANPANDASRANDASPRRYMTRSSTSLVPQCAGQETPMQRTPSTPRIRATRREPSKRHPLRVSSSVVPLRAWQQPVGGSTRSAPAPAASGAQVSHSTSSLMTRGTESEARTRSGRVRASQSSPPRLSGQATKRFRRTLAACGRREHGGTDGWADPCQTCPGGGSHEGARLCFACHQEPTTTKKGQEWRHVALENLPSAEIFWGSVALSTRQGSLVRADYTPTTDCLCARSGCFFALYKNSVRAARRENERSCATCGTRVTSRWRRAGARYRDMQHFFGTGVGALKVDYHLNQSGVQMTMDSDVCNACSTYMRLCGKAIKLPAGARREQLVEAGEAGDERARSMRSVSIFILQDLQEGKAVSLDRGALRLQEELRRRGAQVLSRRQESTNIRDLFDDLAGTVEDVYVQTFAASELELRDGDNRRVYVYIAPGRLALKSYVQLEQDLAHMRDKEGRSQDSGREVDGSGPTSTPAVSAMDKNLNLVKEASRIVHKDLLNSPLNARTRVAVSDLLGTDIPDPVEFVTKEYPATYLAMLAGCMGKDHLCPRSTDDPAATHDRLEGTMGGTDALELYFGGTVLATSALRPKFLPPHYLKLSQFCKSHGVGEKVTRLLSRIGVCCSDKARWGAEETIVETRRDEEIIPEDDNIVVSAAWDNCDTDATAKYQSAVHNGNIAATVNYRRSDGTPARLAPEEKWTKYAALTFDKVSQGSEIDRHSECWERFMGVMYKVIHRSPEYLSARGDGKSCLEAELRKDIPDMGVELETKLAFVMPGSTKQVEDCKDALERLNKVCRGRRTVVEGDEETYRLMVNLKSSIPWNYEWILPIPGGWHLMLHASKALLQRYYAAGIESICRECDADDNHVALGRNYRRNHHWLMVMYEALWCCVIECYTRAHEGVRPGDEDIERYVIPWFRVQASGHRTLEFWMDFLLEHMPPYLAIRVGVRSGNFKLRVAGIRKLAPFFTGTGKDRYQWMIMHFLADLARMPDSDRNILESVSSATWSGRPFASLALDENMEMYNRTIKQSLTKVTQAYAKKLAAIVEARKGACGDVEQRFFEPFQVRDPTATLVHDRTESIMKVLPFLRNSCVFSDEGKDSIVSLSHMVATKANVDRVRNAKKECLESWESMFHHTIRGGEGKKPTKKRIDLFTAQNKSARKGKGIATGAARKEWKDMSLLAREYHDVVKTVLDSAERMNEEQRKAVVSQIGAVLPLAMAHSEGGARKTSKSSGVAWFIQAYCGDAVQETPFYDSDGHAVDLPTELHRTPPQSALEHGGVGVMGHYIEAVRRYCQLGNEPQFVAICNDVGTFIPPIKAHEQASRSAGMATTTRKWNASSMSALPGGGRWQAFLRSHGNRYAIACSIRRQFERPDIAKVRGSDTLVFYGCGGLDPPPGDLGVQERKVSFDMDESAEDLDESLDDLWLWRAGAATHQECRGPRIGEGELAATHFVIHHQEYDGGEPRRRWTITSIDTDQVLHVLLAMARDLIPPDGDDKVQVTVRRRRGQGAADFLLVNRLYQAVHSDLAWQAPAGRDGDGRTWLTREAKVVVFVFVYLLSGCDFLPSMHNMPFKTMLPYAIDAISEGDLFGAPLVWNDDAGKWAVCAEDGVKLIATCYIRMHRRVFEAASETASSLFLKSGSNVEEYVATVRETIWRTHGPKGKLNCPAFDALDFQARRGATVLTYWQAAFEKEMVLPEFRNNGWAVESGKSDELLHSDNVVIQLSEKAFLTKGKKLRVISCSCKAQKPSCANCVCGKRGLRCTPGHCGCGLRCMLGDNPTTCVISNDVLARDVEGGEDLGVRSDGDSGDDSDSDTSSASGCDGTLEDLGFDL